MKSSLTKKAKICTQDCTSNKKEIDSDEILVKRSIEGENVAFEELVKRYESKIYSVIYNLMGNKEDTEELLQETFLKAYRFLSQFKQEAKFITWLYHIATNTCLQKLKKNRKTVFCLSYDDTLLETQNNISNIPDWSNNPDETFMHKELTLFIEKAIAKLPEKLRVIFVLRDIEGFSNKEVAQILNIPMGTIKSYVHRSRLYLRQRLNYYFQT